MTNKCVAHIFVVDDDSCIRDTIFLNLKKAKFECTCFSNADDCIQQLRLYGADLLITDVRMPGKDGLELLSEAKCIAPWLPVLVITSYGDISMAVRAVKAGAIDFIEKPLKWDAFLSLIRTSLKQNALISVHGDKPLTRAETIILHLILQGKSNKEMACILHRSIRTVEDHRNHIMHKFNVDNVVELVKKATSMGLLNKL